MRLRLTAMYRLKHLHDVEYVHEMYAPGTVADLSGPHDHTAERVFSLIIDRSATDALDAVKAPFRVLCSRLAQCHVATRQACIGELKATISRRKLIIDRGFLLEHSENQQTVTIFACRYCLRVQNIGRSSEEVRSDRLNEYEH